MFLNYSILIQNFLNYCICMCLCVQVCMNFGDRILLRGEECKTREKFNFSEKV